MLLNQKTNSRASAPAARGVRLSHPEVPGPLWNGKKRVARKQIRAYCRILAREFHPRKIILFGSYASGSPKPESDVDLVMVMPFKGKGTEQVVEIRRRVEAPFPLDLILWRPADLRRRDSFARSVLKEVKLMYEGQHP